MDYKKMYEDLAYEFSEYKKQSIKWSVADILDADASLTHDEARLILENVISKHDASVGITWDNFTYYIHMFKLIRNIL